MVDLGLDQGCLFHSNREMIARETSLGPDRAYMETVIAASIFSPATGYIRRSGFDWSCNPYTGCSFGCTYCYAMFLPQNRRPRAQWGRWFQAKANAVELARRDAAKVAGQCVYISTVTDPYLPAERTLRLTRGILQELLPFQPRVLVQTRGPLVVRDIDVLQQFRALRVNFSIPTDSEGIRRQFEPKAPVLSERWESLARLKAAGIRVGLCVTPLLPMDDAAAFARRIKLIGPDVVAVEDFHDAHGKLGGDTGPGARTLLAGRGWSDVEYQSCVARLREAVTVYEGERGFFPP
jgi:DNA repair photolyase